MVSARGVAGWGIGAHSTMIYIIPIILLFSYTRNHNNPKADIAIPISGILLAVFGMIIIGVIFTSRYAARIREFKLRLLGKTNK